MKIQNSSISMSSTHSFISFSYMESATIEGRASDDLEGVILSLSKEAENGSYTEAIESFEKQQKEEAERRQAENFKNMMKPLETNNNFACPSTSDETDWQIELIKQMLAILSKGRNSDEIPMKNLKPNSVLDLRSRSPRIAVSNNSTPTSAADIVQAKPIMRTSTGGTMWTKISATSASVTEYESTTFASKGIVQTEDGRNIDFNVSFSMSRACEAHFNSLEVSNYILTDPLVINLDTDMTEISDQKFFFDIDSDGKEEEISELGAGSGFLALDKNGDGIINDGSELFGTKSGDGFKDLAAYNEDGNHWIDENDSIFHKLKIWMKDEDGNDILLDLKQADIGAIYLKNADTEYSFKDESLNTNGVMRKTGVYLKESSGKVGTMSHVDLAV